MKKKKLDWIPDWRDASQYPAPDELDLQGWAWEFLRRNTDYQNDWRTVVENQDLWVFNGDLEDIREEHARQPSDVSCAPIYIAYGAKWGLSLHMKNPAEAFRVGIPASFTSNPPPKVVDYFEVDGVACPAKGRPSRWGEIAFIFNLERPIAPQIDWAKLHMAKRRELLVSEGRIELADGRNHVYKFPAYLRCFDANIGNRGDVGARGTREPAVVFGCTEKEVRNDWNTAKRLVAGAYRKIPSSKKAPP